MIENLRQEANTFNRTALISLRILVGLSCIMYALFHLYPLAALIVSFSSQLLFNNLPSNPLLPKESILSTPLRVIFSASSLLIHYFLAFNLSSQFRVYFYPYSYPTPVSYRFLYSISVLAPTTSLFFEIPWKVAIWWSYTPLVVFAVHRVTNSIENIDREIANLEGMKYKAPGAWAVYQYASLLTYCALESMVRIFL